MEERLGKNFFKQKTEKVAQELLGKILVRKIGRKIIKGKILETEAYLGIQDKACHTAKGKTARNKVMFGPAGFWYVYLIYGKYHCLNIVTEEVGKGCAVLIRSVAPLCGLEKDIKTDGPGKLCRAFKINSQMNNINSLDLGANLYFEKGDFKGELKIKKAKRIGIDYAGEKWKNRLLRFYLVD